MSGFWGSVQQWGRFLFHWAARIQLVELKTELSVWLFLNDIWIRIRFCLFAETIMHIQAKRGIYPVVI
jgi:hypothetical protein